MAKEVKELAHLDSDLGYSLFSAGWDAAMEFQAMKNSIKRGKIVSDTDVERLFLCSADITLHDGSTVQLSLSIERESYEPMVTLGDRTFVLSWDDIVEFADAAGLFDDSEVTE